MNWLNAERLRRIEHVGLSKPELALLSLALDSVSVGEWEAADPVMMCRRSPMFQCDVVGKIVAGARRLGQADWCAWRCAKALDELCSLSLEGGWIREDLSDWTDRDPAAHALYNDMPKLALLLVDRGASVDAQLHDGDPLIVWFARSGCHLLEFLDRAPDLNARGSQGGNFLHHLSRADKSAEPRSLGFYRAIISKAKEHHFDLDARDHEGRSPLHWAAQVGNRDFAQTLIEAGADPLAPNAAGRSPWEEGSSQSVVEYLEAVALSVRERRELGSVGHDLESMVGHAALVLMRSRRVKVDGREIENAEDWIKAAESGERLDARQEVKGRL